MRDYDNRLDDFDKNFSGLSAADSAGRRGQTVEYVRRTEVFNFNFWGETEFYQAVVEKKPIAYLQELIDEGADESVRCEFAKETALLCSVSMFSQSPDVVSFLIQTPNAPVNVGNHNGTTPLHRIGHMIRSPWYMNRLTEKGGSVMVYVEQLLSKDANPFIKDEDGYTPRDLFIEAIARMSDPTDAHAIINRLKMAEDGLFQDINNQRLMAVMMSKQKRIGADSQLSQIEPEILRMIVDSMGALLTPDDIGEMNTEKVRALKRIGSTHGHGMRA
jgi:hypothetical protein